MSEKHFSIQSNLQQGASAVEFVLVAIPILLVALGTIELSRWFFTKQAISLALLEAGRAGITDHARPASIEAAFEHALLPLFAADSKQKAAKRLQQAFERRLKDTGAPPWIIQVQNPIAPVFLDFASPHIKVAGAPGLAVIDNNHLAQQHEQYKAQGRPDGRGPLSGATIFEANNLRLKLTYMHEPLVPGMHNLFKLLSMQSDAYAQQALQGGYLPLSQTLQLTMQSHPVAWSSSSAKVITAPVSASAEPIVSSGQNWVCSGIWCPNTASRAIPANQTRQTVAGPHSTGNSNVSDWAFADQAPQPGEQPGLPQAENALCGVVLCCQG